MVKAAYGDFTEPTQYLASGVIIQAKRLVRNFMPQPAKDAYTTEYNQVKIQEAP